MITITPGSIHTSGTMNFSGSGGPTGGSGSGHTHPAPINNAPKKPSWVALLLAWVKKKLGL